jgi:hypothetical protein
VTATASAASCNFAPNSSDLCHWFFLPSPDPDTTVPIKWTSRWMYANYTTFHWTYWLRRPVDPLSFGGISFDAFALTVACNLSCLCKIVKEDAYLSYGSLTARFCIRLNCIFSVPLAVADIVDSTFKLQLTSASYWYWKGSLLTPSVC